MYDSHIYCKEYKDLKDYIADCINGDITDYDVEKLSNRIQELYDNDEMPSSQYDDLMSYVQEMQEKGLCDMFEIVSKTNELVDLKIL